MKVEQGIEKPSFANVFPGSGRNITATRPHAVQGDQILFETDLMVQTKHAREAVDLCLVFFVSMNHFVQGFPFGVQTDFIPRPQSLLKFHVRNWLALSMRVLDRTWKVIA